MNIRSIRIEIDIQEYLESKGLHKVRLVGDNVMACCPYHEERNASFGVNVDTGAFNCFGCGAKGSFQLLVKKLDKFDTVFDAETFLIQNYGKYAISLDEELTLTFGDDDEHQDYWIDEGSLVPYKFRHPYLGGRGIEEAWQRFYEVGYSKRHQAITIPWRDESHRLITVKFRSVRTKQFWYDPPLPSGLKAETLWGLSQIIRAKPMAIALTEAEIDGISVSQGGWSRKILAAGIGGNQFNRKQASKLIRYLPSGTEVINFTDNDDGGRLAQERITDYLSGRFRLSTVDWSLIGRDVKDANDLTKDEIGYLLDRRKSLGIELFI